MKKLLLTLVFGIISILLQTSLVMAELDTSPPSLTGVRAESIMYTGAQIKWSTDDAATSKVYIGTSADNKNLSFDSRCDSGGYVREHCVNLWGLSFSTIYYVKIESTNEAGLSSFSDSYQFTSGTDTGGSSSSHTSTSYSSTSGTSSGTSSGSSSYTSATTNSSSSGSTSSGSSSSGFSSFSDITPPSVIQFGNLTESDGRVRAGASFSEQIDASSISSGNVYIINAETGDKVEGVVGVYWSGVDYVTNAPAVASTDYKLVVREVKDVTGNKQQGEYRSVSFQRGASRYTTSSSTTISSYSNTTNETSASTTTMSTTRSSLESSATAAISSYYNAVSATSGPKTISGRVLFSDGKSVTDAYVSAYQTSTGLWTEVSTDAIGGFVLKVSGGVWKVGVHPKGENVSWAGYASSEEVTFEKSEASEFRSVNFTLPKTDSAIVVRAVDEVGNPLSGVGVMLDTASPQESYSNTGPRITDSDTTDSTGVATFFVRSGVYYIRGYSPQSDYLNPKEQSISASPSIPGKVTLVFSKKTSSSLNAVNLSGAVIYEDGVPAGGAFVGAWSEEGEFRQMTAESNGNFSLSLTKRSRWHIGASKEVARIPYKSSEILLIPQESVDPITLLLRRYKDAPLPKSIEQITSISEDAVIRVSDGAQVIIGANTAEGALGSTLNVEITPTIEAPSQATSQVVSTVYDVSVRDGYGKDITNFTQKIEVVLPYDEKELQLQGATEETIKPGYLDEKTGMWIIVDDYVIDKVKNIIIVRVDHLTRFAIVSAADITPPAAPINLVASVVGSAVQLRWENPRADFDHAKVYRSRQSGKLGTVLAGEVNAVLFVDTTTEKNEVYYYVVRAIDSAGNESVNENQVKVVGVGKTFSAAAPPASLSGNGSFAKTLRQRDRGTSVTLLQRLLINEGVYPEALVTGYFGSKTFQAVVRLQEKYASELLTPVGLSKGTGIVGPLTRKKLQNLLRE